MMAECYRHSYRHSARFNSVQLYRHETLGIGAYGKVCKAKCDSLLCAAKIIHETLFDPVAEHMIAPQREHRQPMRRFEQECEFMSTIRHPNIVQYLGMCQDPDTGLPILLMELMDDSLTRYLERSSQPIPYHIQVNFCHDMTLALSFLHSNGISHRDLSSNNILLIQNVRAKIADFGMARLGELNSETNRPTFTVCPGTDVYMPPEVVVDKPKYTEKIDCFSFGVLVLQMLTREFPNPGDRRRVVPSEYPGLPSGSVLEIRVPEIDRRQSQINKVDPNHHLLAVALDCLKDNHIERPSAQDLCERVAALKETSEYFGSETALQESFQLTRSSESHLLASDKQEQLHGSALQQEEKIQQLSGLIKEKEKQLEYLQQQLETSQRVITDYENQICGFKQRLSQLQDIDEQQESTATDSKLQLNWREDESKAPCKMSRRNDAVVSKERNVYITYKSQIYEYRINHCWNKLPKCPYDGYSIAIVNDLLTAIGGFHDSSITNQLFSLTGNDSSRKWTEELPPMPTKRDFTIALCAERALIVMGGMNEQLVRLRTVEVMNTETFQWSSAASLPEKLYLVSATFCGDSIFLLGGWKNYRIHNDSVYTCSLSALLQSSAKTLGGHLASALSLQSSVWSRITSLPVTQSVCVSLNGQLLAIGGYSNADKNVTTDVHWYNQDTKSWEVISHMIKPRCRCFAAVLPGNQLMVVGGNSQSYVQSDGDDQTDSVEFALVMENQA